MCESIFARRDWQVVHLPVRFLATQKIRLDSPGPIPKPNVHNTKNATRVAISYGISIGKIRSAVKFLLVVFFNTLVKNPLSVNAAVIIQTVSLSLYLWHVWGSSDTNKTIINNTMTFDQYHSSEMHPTECPRIETKQVKSRIYDMPANCRYEELWPDGWLEKRIRSTLGVITALIRKSINKVSTEKWMPIK